MGKDAAPMRIVVLGGGTAGWMAACLLNQRWGGSRAEIAVLESPDIGIIGVGEGSTPQLKYFFDTLGIAEAEWMPRCNATYKTGITFAGWARRPGFERYFHPFPSQLDANSAPGFYLNCAARRRGIDVCADPNRFFLNAHLADKKLGPTPAHSFPFRVSYGYHFDAYLVGAFLREHATGKGVRHIEGRVAKVDVDAAGDVAALLTDDGRRIEADFFVDSSGFRAVIAQEALGARFRSFKENLFNDSAVVMPTPRDPAGVNSQTIATAMSAGWAWDIPLTSRTGNGYVYSSDFISADAAERELRAKTGLEDSDVAARHLKMKVGRIETAWTGNCLAVGLSQGFVEPLEATALHVVQETVERFIEAFEQGGFAPTRRDAFNAEIAARFEGIRDYIVCHYKISYRPETEYWRACAGIEALSDSLRRILECWMRGADLSHEIDQQRIAKYYAPASWHCILAGYGLFPDPDKLRPQGEGDRRVDMAAIDDFLSRCALNFRTHDEDLAALAAASQGAAP